MHTRSHKDFMNTHFTKDQFMIKCESINSLWNRECIYISYWTLPITHKLIYGQI